ncbi:MULTISPECIES: nucleoside triphosphate pyrophosphohydrolase [Thalassobaculum]|uniref:Nucleoside triphosphate pyrophosphohydrolase n=1 Tax=Thalassobaculum litoreum DSM 18839 TaxID=1123362 RepID=A0A8G2EX96_9PROT|nr:MULTISPECIES: nucleoside triphosphate pyrophosphohydrolase [Thalassobaculum]SDF12106.1 ATP diphosphatase [Thalassobaculum litoreum DSM 18839]
MTDSAPTPDPAPDLSEELSDALAALPDEPAIARLIAVMAKLRDPDGGCPWDLEQNFETIAPYTIEEAYEVAEAITLGDMASLRDELGDLLLQVVYHAQMARELAPQDGAFDFEDVARGIADKMIRRHPHVFAGASVEDAKAQTDAWEKQKAVERAAKAAAENRTVSVLDGVSSALPALMRSLKLQNRAVRAGFDWPDIDGVFDKIDEELGELRAEVTGADSDDPARIEDEVGDLLFTVVNLARRLDIDPETALRRCNAKFERRFRFMEDGLAAEGTPIQSVGLDEMERHWQRAKQREKR